MNFFKTFFEKLKSKNQIGSPSDVNTSLPTYMGQVAIYRDRIRVAKWALFGVFIFSLLVISIQEMRASKLATALSEKDFLIVPGAPEFMRIRPGLIAPESVYLFAEYVASELSTFSYNTVDRQYQALAEFMTPELKTRFLLSMERPVKMYRELRVDQIFDSEPVKNFDLKNDARGAKYIVKVRGLTRKYVEGNLRETVPIETTTFVFRPRKIKPGQPWFFEIESFERFTPEEEEKDRALDSLNNLEKK